MVAQRPFRLEPSKTMAPQQGEAEAAMHPGTEAGIQHREEPQVGAALLQFDGDGMGIPAAGRITEEMDGPLGLAPQDLIGIIGGHGPHGRQLGIGEAGGAGLQPEHGAVWGEGAGEIDEGSEGAAPAMHHEHGRERAEGLERDEIGTAAGRLLEWRT